MTHINQRNQLDKRITDYVRFLKIATRSQAVKLSKEIAKLSERIATIDDMSLKDQKKKLAEYHETKQSKMNFKTIENPKAMNRKRNPPEKCKPIFNEPKDSRRRAMELVEAHVDVKPIKYLLKK